MVSVAGIRGIVGESLVPEEFVKYVAAFASTLKKREVVVGGDTRPSRHMLRPLVMGTLMAAGCHVVDLGIVPTPTIGFMTRHLGAGGGIGITASHNPLQWNALKFFSPEGTFLVGEDFERLLENYRSERFSYVSFDKLGSVEALSDPAAAHLKQILKAVDGDRVAGRGFRVAVDLCNGAGIALVPQLLERLGCKTSLLFEDPDRAFERVAEPLAVNLGALCELVRTSKADVGFAIDPDADRLALVDETGRAIGEERTLTLAARFVLGKTGAKTPLVANLSTTRALDDVAAEFGTHVERTRIGEANVVARILEKKAVIGGEGNGGVIFPAIHPGRDSGAGIALILEALAASGKTLSQLNSEVPDYVMVKDKISIEGKDVADILERLKGAFSADAVSVSELDGLKISLPDSWVHVRASGTEPIVRVFSEAPTVREAGELVKRAMGVVAS